MYFTTKFGDITIYEFRVVTSCSGFQATDMVVLALVLVAVILILVPIKHLVLVTVVEILTREMPLRKNTTTKVRRKFKDWWARIPVVPVQITRLNRDEKSR